MRSFVLRSPSGEIVKGWGLCSPDGSIVSGKSLKKFCIANALSYKSMAAVANGRKGQYKGWTLPQPVEGKSI